MVRGRHKVKFGWAGEGIVYKNFWVLDNLGNLVGSGYVRIDKRRLS